MKIDYESPVPLYFQIQQLLKEQILNGSYSYGDEIPTEMELCEIFGVSRYTVRQALDGLVKEKIIQRKKRKGTIVTYNAEYPRINSILGRVRKNQQYKLLKCEKRAMSQEMKVMFGDTTSDEIVFFCRAQISEQRLVAIDSIYLLPKWSEEILQNPEENIMLHRCLEKNNNILLDYEMNISVGNLNLEEMQLAGISENTPSLTMYTEANFKSERVFIGKTVFVDNYCYINLNFETIGEKLSFSDFAINKNDISQKYNFL